MFCGLQLAPVEAAALSTQAPMQAYLLTWYVFEFSSSRGSNQSSAGACWVSCDPITICCRTFTLRAYVTCPSYPCGDLVFIVAKLRRDVHALIAVAKASLVHVHNEHSTKGQPVQVARHIEEPGPGSLTVRSNAPRLSLPPRSGEGSSFELSARSPSYHTDRPPPKSRLPRFTRQPGAESSCSTVNASTSRPPTKRFDGPVVSRCASMPASRSMQTPTDTRPPSRLGSSFGTGGSTVISRTQQRRTSNSLKATPRSSSNVPYQGNLAPPHTSRTANIRPKQPIPQPCREVCTRKPSFRSQTRPSHMPTGHPPLQSPTPHRLPPPQPTAQSQSSNQCPTHPRPIPSPATSPDRNLAGASTAAPAATAAPLGLDLTPSRGQEETFRGFEDELDCDLDEELRGMSFLSTASQHMHSARRQKAGAPFNDFSLSPSPMSSAASHIPNGSNISPPVHPASQHAMHPVPHPFSDGPHTRKHDRLATTATTLPSNRNQTSAARQIDFADATPSHDSDLQQQQSTTSPTPCANEQSPQGVVPSRATGCMRSSAPPAYLGGVSLLAVADHSESEDFGFGGLGFEDSTPSLSNEGRSPWTYSLQTAPVTGLHMSPATAAAVLQTDSPVLAAPHSETVDTSATTQSPPVALPAMDLQAPEAASSPSAPLSAASTCTPLAQMPQAQITSSDLLEASANMLGTRIQ